MTLTEMDIADLTVFIVCTALIIWALIRIFTEDKW